MKQDDDNSMYCHSQQSPSQPSQHLIPSLSEGTSFGEFLPDEPVNEASATLVHGDEASATLVHGDDGSADHQISQLRKLLEKNLPQKVGEFEPVLPLQGFCDLRDNLQRKSSANTGLVVKSSANTGLVVKSSADTGLGSEIISRHWTGSEIISKHWTGSSNAASFSWKRVLSSSDEYGRRQV